MIAHLRIPGHRAAYFRIHPAADVPDIIADDARRQDHRRARDGVMDAADILVGDAVGQDGSLASLFRPLLSLARLDAGQNDVLAAQALVLLLRIVARAFAHGEHGDERTKA